jgi:acetylornithine/succinyldiaminopimelate/putrescine aminotransferase
MVKSTSGLRGLRDIRTTSGSRKRFTPHSRASAYLRLYTLQMENDRLSPESQSIERRQLMLQRRLKEIHGEIDRLAQQSGTEVSSAALKMPRRPRRTSVSAITVRQPYGGRVTASEGD